MNVLRMITNFKFKNKRFVLHNLILILLFTVIYRNIALKYGNDFEKKYLSEARRRGLSLADCRGVLGYVDNQQRRLTNTEVCNGATTVNGSGYARWDKKFSDACVLIFETIAP